VLKSKVSSYMLATISLKAPTRNDMTADAEQKCVSVAESALNILAATLFSAQRP
jgi:hypothetical protein